METRRVWPPRLVEVFADGEWRRAQLEAWKRSDTGLQASVRYCVLPGYGLSEAIWIDRARLRVRQTTSAIETALHGTAG
jgi:hypothetical protein